MNRRGDSSALKLVMSMVVILALLAFIFLGPFNFLNTAVASLVKCDGACSTVCEIEYTSAYRPGDAYCEESGWNVAGVSRYESRIDAAANLEGSSLRGASKTNVLGKKLGLRCCAIRNDENLPAYYLRQDRWVADREDEARTSFIAKPPKVVAYFGGDAESVRKDGRRDIVSNQDIPLQLKLEEVGKKQGIFAYNWEDHDAGDVNAAYTLEKQCTAKILDEDNNDITPQVGLEQALREVCNAFNDTQNKERVIELNIPSTFEDRVLELQIAISTVAGRIDPNDNTDVLYNLFIRVRNPLLVEGFTGAFVSELSVELSCFDEFYDCTQFAVAQNLTQGQASDCSSLPQSLYQNATPTNPGEARFTINQTGYVCFQANTTTVQNLYYSSVSPVNIDRVPPVFSKLRFNPITVSTNVTCQEDPTTGSGCANAVGYYFIWDPIEFISAECMVEHSLYRWVPAQNLGVDQTSVIIPFAPRGGGGLADVAVMCVRIQDDAGNFNTKAVVTYDLIDDFVLLLSQQINNQGFGLPGIFP